MILTTKFVVPRTSAGDDCSRSTQTFKTGVPRSLSTRRNLFADIALICLVSCAHANNNKAMQWRSRSRTAQLKDFTPGEISVMVLTEMRETAEAVLGKKVTQAAVTVPAYFHEAHRPTIKNAGTIPDLTALPIVNKTTAAALAYVYSAAH
ncbi:HSP70-domain-containing protein [Ceratobasidium sp. AG-I]|nr:HSP70-domain-containing protein [Ceratobasidium sp. AG-I]